jgi:ATP-dependent DNA helicase RecG
VQIAEKIGVSTTAIEKNIKKLQEKGIIKRVGPDKGGHWKIIQQ